MSWKETLFRRREKFILIEESKYGIIAHVSEHIENLHDAYKGQIVALLKEVIKKLEK